MVKRGAAVILLLLLFFIFVKPASSAEVSEYGDWMHIRVTSVVSPLIDEYGRPTMNPDGTFYPNDAFKLGYIVEVDPSVNFEEVKVSYDRQTFIATDMSGWGGLSGSGSFRVSLYAQPGTYPFTVTAKANKTIDLGGGRGSSLMVTYGGAEVNAYYIAWCRLRISAGAGGTTDPAPGEYWFEKGELVIISAIPNENYTVNYWVVDGAILPNASIISVRMDRPHDVKVTFSQVNSTSSQSAAALSMSSPTALKASMIPPPVYLMDAVGSAAITQGSSTPYLIIKNFVWLTYFNFFRGTVCQAKGILYSSEGKPLAKTPVTVDFLKKNIFTGAMWITQVTALTDDNGRFIIEDTCIPISEAFLNAVAWAEKPGYLPTWRIKLYVNKLGGEVERGRLLIFGLRVDLEGRLSDVPVSLHIENLPRGCSVEFSPQSGYVGLFNQFISMGKIYASDSAALGQYAVKIVSLSSSGVKDEKPFSLTVKRFEEKTALSTVAFKAYGLDADAEGLILVLDSGTINERRVNVNQMPYAVAWKVDSTHVFLWMDKVGSRIDGKKYTFSRAEVIMRYIAVSTAYVTVVKYEPHFTLLLAYSVLNSTTDITNTVGESSFEKPLAFLIRYDGNGPNRNPMQRALLEDFTWNGWLLRGLNETGLQVQAGKLMNLTSILPRGNFYFYAHGLDETVLPEDWVLMVDGSMYFAYNVPVSFNWPPGSTHSYSWKTTVNAIDGGFFRLHMVTGTSNKTSGTITVPAYGGAIIANYIKHRHPHLFFNPWERHERVFLNWTRARLYYANGTLACAYDIYNNDPVPPLLFGGDVRYAVFIFKMDDLVMKRALEQNYTALDLYTYYYSSRFTPSPILAAEFNYTLFYEVFEQLVHVKAVKPTSNGGWEIDRNVFFNITFSLGPVLPEKELYSAWFRNQTEDEVAVKIALEDIYEPVPQWIAGRGETCALLNKTSIHIFKIDVLAEGYGRRVKFTVDRAYVKFREDPYFIYINFAGGGVNASIIEDTGEYSKLNFTALYEAGGIKSIRIYDDRGRLLLERDYGLMAETQQGLFGFAGQKELTFRKLPGSGSIIRVEAENVWGARTTLLIEVLPYLEPPFITLLNQIGFLLACLIVAVVIITFLLRFFRRY